MSDHLKFERFYWFDREVRNQRYPNATTLARRFEISGKTAQRSIDYMRDTLCAPLDYDAHRRGYFYTESGFALPAFEVSQNELLAILLAQNLLSGSAGGLISHSIRSFGRKLFATTGAIGLSEERINTAFSAVWHGYTPAEAETFRIVADALVQRRRLVFRYFAPSTNESTDRLVEPAHLQHYMGSWILLAFCTDRQAWRKFHLGRMRQVRLTGTEFSPVSPACVLQHLQGAFGIFQSGQPQEVALHFNAYRARWLRDEFWHPDQVIEEQPDGSLVMRFTVTDLREVKLRVLQYGAQVEVLAPVELREEVLAEIGLMIKVYEED